MTGNLIDRSFDPSLCAPEFSVLSRIAAEEAGLHLPQEKATMVISRVARRLRHLQLPDLASYCRLVSGEDGQDERKELIRVLTTNVTKFYREDHHFDFLQSQVLPRLATQARQGNRVRIWSAGCSSGEEPYSIAMAVLDTIPDAAKYDIRILATDIDCLTLDRARRGVYEADTLGALPARYRDLFLSKTADGTPGACQVASDLRDLVVFRELNLIRPWPMRGTFDVIFCRNVVIYFNQQTQDALWPRFAAMLTPGGHLILGHSERIDTQLHPMFSTVSTTTYQRGGTDVDAPSTSDSERDRSHGLA